MSCIHSFTISKHTKIGTDYDKENDNTARLFSKPGPSHWTYGLVSATLEMCDNAIRVPHKCCVIERQVTYWAPPIKDMYIRTHQRDMCMEASVLINKRLASFLYRYE